MLSICTPPLTPNVRSVHTIAHDLLVQQEQSPACRGRLCRVLLFACAVEDPGAFVYSLAYIWDSTHGV